MTLRDELASLATWLTQNAPATSATLRNGATDTELAILAEHLGRPLLPDVTELLRWHNGSEDILEGLQLWPGMWFIQSEKIARDWQLRNDAKEDEPEVEWERTWVPIASSSGGGHLVVDHGKGPYHGRVFRVDMVDGKYSLGAHDNDFWFPGLTELVEHQVASLVNHSSLARRLPIVDNGRLTWQRT